MPGGEKHASSILESITEAFFAIDRRFCFSYVNRAAELLLRRSRKDLIGKCLFEVFPGARGTKFEQCYREALSGTRADFIEYFAPHDLWYEVHAYPSSDGASVFLQDVSERRHAEEDYRRRREQMELVVRGARVGIWYCPLPFDELIWDGTVREHFHVSLDERITLETFYERLHPDDRERMRAAMDAALAGGPALDIDFRTVARDASSTKWIRAIGRALFDKSGAPLRFDGITIDVSDRKRAELAMQASEERYRLATRATNDVIWDWDLATGHIRWNESLEARFGHALTNHSASGGFWIEHIDPADRVRVLTGIHRAIDDPDVEHWADEYRFQRADGTYADVLDRGFVLRDASGTGVRMIGAMQDLTERKRVERERERMIEAERAARSEVERQSRLKDEFLASLSHELRTPLNAILGWSQILLSREPKSSDAIRGLEVVERNARAQAAIVDELLDMSRLMSGKVRLDVRPLDVREVITAAVDTARPAAEAKKIALRSKIASQTELWVCGDPGRLQQVLWNLLTNAIKFTPRGGHVWVDLEGSSSSIDIRISDTGEGIRPDFLPYIFERFRQADASSTRRHGGLGLGLSIVKQLVELHGGSVMGTSRGLGLGSMFTVSLPALPADIRVRVGERDASAPDSGRCCNNEDSTAAGQVASQLDIAGLRILVVDDDLDARSFVSQLLQDRQAVVTTAASAAEAMALLESGAKFDVLVSDIGMPGEDGYSLIRRVRALGRGRGGDIPAIALTAYARAEDRVRAVAAGFMMHVAKPLEAAELITMVAGAAGRTALTA